MYFSVISTTVLLTASLLSAQDRGGRPGGPPGGMMRFNPILAALDSNQDSVLSAAELDKAPSVLKSLDKDSDGRITMEEVRPNFGPGGPGGPGMRGPGGPGGESGPSPETLVSNLMSFDKNGDGKLSKDELPERMLGMLARGDSDKDGFLNREEILKMAQSSPARAGGAAEGRGRGEGRPEGRPEGRAERGGEGRGPGGPGGPRRMDPVFAALDANQDGAISGDEITNAKAALMKLDRNGDGQIGEEEVRPNFRGPGGPGGPPQRREQ